MQNKGCLGILKSVQDNPVSALELLDFSVRAFHKPHLRSFPQPWAVSFRGRKWGLEKQSALPTYMAWPSPSSIPGLRVGHGATGSTPAPDWGTAVLSPQTPAWVLHG